MSDNNIQSSHHNQDINDGFNDIGDNQQNGQENQQQQQQQQYYNHQDDILPDIDNTHFEFDFRAQTRHSRHMKSIDHFINKIDLGKYQFILVFILSICLLCEGAEVISISFLNLILQNIWGLSQFQISLFGSCVFGGVFLGSLISGFFADSFGRRNIFLWTCFLLIATNIVSSLAPNFIFLVISRSIFGICAGVAGPLSCVILVESTPVDWRGKILIIISSAFTIGEIVGVIIAYYALGSFTDGHWRLLQMWVSIPSSIAFFIALVYLRESPRYLLYTNFEEGITLLQDLYSINNREDEEWIISPSERNSLKNWLDNQLKHESTQGIPFTHLFQGINALITPLVWFMWFSLSFVYYGVIYILPTILNALYEQNTEFNFLQLLISIFGEIPAYFLCYFTIEEPFFGRKYSLIYSFILGGGFGVLAFFTRNWFLILNIFMLKFFATSGFGFVYPFTTEVYHTKYRTTGFGFAAGISRLGGAMMPWISNYSYAWEITGPFLIYGLLFMGGTLAALLLPFDTQGKELDQIEIKTEDEHKTLVK